MPHSGLQSTIQLALHFGGVNATPGFLLNGWRKLFFHFDGMARAQLMNTLSAYCYCAAYYSRYRCTFLLPTLICRRFILTRFTNTADLHSSAASVQCAAITASSSMSLELKPRRIVDTLMWQCANGKSSEGLYEAFEIWSKFVPAQPSKTN